MSTIRELFYKNLAQTSPAPLALEIERAEGVYLFDSSGKKYIDLISGISVSNVGHRHPAVLKAINEQLDKYMHLMVYGEYVQSPQVKFAKRLTELLPASLNAVYFVNSGAEAIEGSMKLAKRFTGRTEIISFKNAYHGSTQGALSIMGDERLKKPFYPLLPDTKQLSYNSFEDIELISNKTACVIVEPVQGEAGIVLPDEGYLKALRKKCTEVGALLIFDEIQTAFGRTGKLFAFENENVIPDVICLAKSLGGGMPLGAFIADTKIMHVLSVDPELGHITTFGGHPVCCAAGMAALEVIVNDKLSEKVAEKEKLFLQLLKHSKIKAVRSKGLLIAVEFENFEINKKIIDGCIANGVIVDWFLFNMNSMRIAPPLTITEEQIKAACSVIINAIN